MLQGRTTIVESQGTSADTAMNKPGSQAAPKLTVIPGPVRDLEPMQASKVAVTLGITKALGEFEFARVDVTIEDYCSATPETRKAALEMVTAEAKDHLTTIASRIKRRS